MTDFSSSEIDDAAREGRLLALDVEVALACETGCGFCRPSDPTETSAALSHRELERVFTGVRDLGARRVSIRAGGWLVYPHLGELFAEIRRLEMELEVSVGTDAVDEERARLLSSSGAGVTVTLHGITDETHERVSECADSAAAVRQTIDKLRAWGYPGRAPLSVQARICHANLDEIVPLWRWARSKGFEPRFENAPEGASDVDPRSGVDPRTLEGLFTELSEVDAREFGKNWDPQPPWPGRADLRHKYACFLSADGTVFPGGDLPLPLGCVRENRIEHVLGESEIIRDFRARPLALKGPCRPCAKSPACAGSRSNAYSHTGDYLGSDPSCWRNQGRLGEITRLPLELTNILPQQPPMQFVDTLVAIGDRTGECEVTIRDDMPMVGGGRLDASAYLEIIAQAMAAVQSYRILETEAAELAGFLVGAQDLEVHSTARVGDVLRVHVRKETRFGQFGVIRGSVSRGDTLMAQGEVKIWQEANAGAS